MKACVAFTWVNGLACNLGGMHHPPARFLLANRFRSRCTATRMVAQVQHMNRSLPGRHPGASLVAASMREGP